MVLSQLCRVVTVESGELPAGHDWVIVAPRDGEDVVDDVVVYVKADERAQLEARVAFLAWDRLRASSLYDRSVN